MASSIFSTDAGQYAACDALSQTKNGFAANANYGPVKVGASPGITENFWGDIGDYWYQGGYPEGEAKFRGDNGKDHWAIFTFGRSECRWLSREISALQFEENNNSTAGRGLFIFRYGVSLTSGSSREIYDLSGKMSRPSSYGKTHQAIFNSTLLGRLRSGSWFLEEFVVEVSSAGGTGSRTTETTITNLKFKTLGTTGKNIVLPVKRLKADRSKTNWISRT